MGLKDFINDLEELTKKYGLSIHSWTDGSGVWISDGNNDVAYDLCWDKKEQKYNYKEEMAEYDFKEFCAKMEEKDEVRFREVDENDI